ncbi:MAG: hypothetical protein ACRD8W_29965 [Nitrososphaeraceae archaeon]
MPNSNSTNIDDESNINQTGLMTFVLIHREMSKAKYNSHNSANKPPHLT